MKHFKIAALLLFGLSFVTCDVMADGGSIEYFGSKTGLFKACKGELLHVCKRIKYPNNFTEPTPNPGIVEIPEYGLMSVKEEIVPEECVTVVYDGVEYEIPMSWINFEDGSIAPH